MNHRPLFWLWLLLFCRSLHAMEVDTECVAEPVFGGEVCIHQANREASQTILLLHGLGDGASRDWEKQWELLLSHYRVVALDLPGFGHSTRGDQQYTPQNYLRLLEHVVDYLELERFDLMGYSMGGTLSLLYSAQYPERVGRLVVVDAAGVLHRMAISRYAVAKLFNGEKKQSHTTESYVAKIIEKFDSWFPFFRDSIAEQDEQTRAGIELIEYDFGQALDEVVADTLIVWGSEDDVSPLRTARVLNKRLQHSRLEIITGAAHMPQKEAAAEFNRVLSRFLFSAGPSGEESIQQEVEQDGDRVGRCDSEKGRQFSGVYRRIEIHNCSEVVIRDASIEELYIFESRVEIVNSIVGGGETGAEVVGSDLKMSASEIHGETGMLAARSRFDLAGVDFHVAGEAIRLQSSSRAIFSVCRIITPTTIRWLHEHVELSAGRGL